jgi:hypothetical protein
MVMVNLNVRLPEQREHLGRRVVRKPFKPPGIRVVPKNEKIRKWIVHPNGVGFRAEGGVEWPHDRFTLRRLADGDVTREEKKAEEQSLEEKKSDQPEEQAEPHQKHEHHQHEHHHREEPRDERRERR